MKQSQIQVQKQAQMEKAKTPISIITGYLGAGKTTLLKKIIHDFAGKRIAILMNEFGEVAIDSKIVKGKNIEMAELLGGCVCCSLTGEFEAAVREILDKIKPEMILVETTGVAEPDAIIIEVEENIPEVRLDGIITLVDCDAVTKFPSLGHTGKIQVEMA
ncbi:MAG: GTP-binding protein, partial [Nanoarchaeota archaeon]